MSYHTSVVLESDLLLLLSLRNLVSWNQNLTNNTIGERVSVNVAIQSWRLLTGLMFKGVTVQLVWINRWIATDKDRITFLLLLDQTRLVYLLGNQWIWYNIHIVPPVWWVLVANSGRHFCFFVDRFADFWDSFKTLLDLNLNFLRLLFGQFFLVELFDFSFGNSLIGLRDVFKSHLGLTSN